MSNNDKILFLDLVTPHVALENELLNVLRTSLRPGRFIGGPMVENFEKDFAEYCDTKYCIGVGSGTDALRFALIAAGVKKGDIVITVPNTFIATTEAISQAGATPEFVDIEERTYNIDIGKLREYIKLKCEIDHKTGRLISIKNKKPVTAIVPVHLYGQMADMDPILELAEENNLIVIEDSCQAHGAEYFSKKENRWRKAGSMGLAAAFSFYPGKNLGACGEGGAVTTSDERIAKKIKVIRDHGQTEKYVHEIEGYNGRLDAIQAGFLGVKLRYLSEWTEKRRQNAYYYNNLLNKVDGIIIPHEPSWTKSVYHLYIVRVHKRTDLQKYLSENNIDTGLHYPVPLHLQKAYVNLGYKKGDFPITEKVALEILSLPMHPSLTSSQQKKVVEKIISHTSKQYSSEQLVNAAEETTL
jgi:dTDP-4-amino-4,6-dideoxygalactose transaminase